jgi:phenylacetate-coenzyme A ligase PaaK-like adenylate-forming protein
METGGMKGRGPELTRTEIHQILNQAFQTENIHSEYGMTELLSQAYSKGNGRFQCPPWMKICIQDTSDPQNWLPNGKTGRICIIDLANLYSCSFIATDDLGKIHEDGSFEIMGRIDFSDIRGCSLLVI